jgi:NADP-dependent 3-hydroxy acid dehydrogenase YdfG
MTRQVWFVTGTSSGFGLATVRELLKEEYKVAATTRFPDKLTSALAGSAFCLEGQKNFDQNERKQQTPASKTRRLQ